MERFFKFNFFILNKKKVTFLKPVSTRAGFLIWKIIYFETDEFFLKRL